MDIEKVRELCLQLKGTTESFPFDKITLVFKVMNKMYCLENLDNKSINLKAEPEKVIELIEAYSAILPGYHMNKKHWITIKLEELSNDKLLKELINNSYLLIISKLNKKQKTELDTL